MFFKFPVLDACLAFSAIVRAIASHKPSIRLLRKIFSKTLNRERIADSAHGNMIQPVMEISQVNVYQTAVVFHIHSNMKPDVVHRTQHAAVVGTRKADHAASLQYPLNLRLGKFVPQQRLEQTLAEDIIQVLELRFRQARHKYRIQGRVVREQRTLAPVDPQQVGVPTLA